MEYFIVFIISIWFANLAQKQFDIGINKTGWLFYFVSMLIPCLLAALRNINIGIDVEFYVTPLLQEAWHSNFEQFLTAAKEENRDLFFSLIMYIGSWSNYPWLSMFIIQFLISAPIYLCLYRYREHIKIWIALFIFYFMYFNTGLCVMRQFVSASFLFLAYSYLSEKKYIPHIILGVIACLSHHFAIVVFALISAIYYAVEVRQFSNKYFIIASLLIVILGMSFFDYLFQNALIDEMYMDRAIARVDEGRFNLKGTMYYSFTIILPYFFIGDNRFKTIQTIATVGFVLMFLGLYTSYFARFSMSLQMFVILSFPYFLTQVKSKHATLLTITLLLATLWYWHTAVVLQTGWGTYPYEMYKF